MAEHTTSEPYYVGFDIGDRDLGPDPDGHARGMTGPVGHWQVDDMENATPATTRSASSSCPGEPAGGRQVRAESRARLRSSHRSSTSSIPTERRIRPSGIVAGSDFHRRRRSWVDSTPPREVA
jgi:hypothetical protein